MKLNLTELKPKNKSLIIDCVRDAGIDVARWALSKSNNTVKHPQSNGAYCYEWSFRGQDNNVMLLCLWYSDIKEDSDGNIIVEGDLNAYADNLTRELERKPGSQKRQISDPRIKRARHFTQTVELASLRNMALRVVIVLGKARQLEDETTSDKAIGRFLDSSSWIIEEFDKNTGAFKLRREAYNAVSMTNCASDAAVDQAAKLMHERVVDQFAVVGLPETYEVHGATFRRNAAVRALILSRSQGACEYCHELGFEMDSGERYLETHHILPLSEGGPDEQSNMIALCPEIHRQAHYGKNREELKEKFLRIVHEKEKY